MKTIGYIEAFERKAELGGGWRGIFKNKLTGDVVKSDVLPTVHEAWQFAREQADTTFRAATNGAFTYAPVRWRNRDTSDRRAYYYGR